MKTPSRFMPKYIHQKGINSLWGWIVTILLISIIAYAFWSEPYALLLLIPIVIIGYFSTKNFEKKMQKLTHERGGLDIGSFAKSFDCKKVDTWVIRAVYEQLQDYINIEKFPILADDDLWKDLEIDKEYFHEDILEPIAQRTRRTLNNIEQNPYFTGTTVRNLVLLFNEQNVDV